MILLTQSDATPTFAVLIPAYNEAATVRDIVCRSLGQCNQVMVIDDGSTDGTADMLEGLPITLIRHAQNQGKGASLLEGLALLCQQGVSAVITLDADGQHAPEDIPRFIEAFQSSDSALVIGSRLHERHKFPADRYRANRIANFWISWAAGVRIDDSQSGYRLYPCSGLHELLQGVVGSHHFVFESEILIDAARRDVRFVYVPIAAVYSQTARKSHFRPVLDILRIARMVALKLITRGFCLRGLVALLRHRDIQHSLRN